MPHPLGLLCRVPQSLDRYSRVAVAEGGDPLDEAVRAGVGNERLLGSCSEDVRDLLVRILIEADNPGVDPRPYTLLDVQKGAQRGGDADKACVAYGIQAVKDRGPFCGRDLVHLVEQDNQAAAVQVTLQLFQLNAGPVLLSSEDLHLADHVIQNLVQGVPFPAVHGDRGYACFLVKLGQGGPGNSCLSGAGASVEPNVRGLSSVLGWFQARLDEPKLR